MPQTQTAHARDAAGPAAQHRIGTDDLGRLLLRIALGGVLFAHGLQKYLMMGVDQVGLFFGSLGIPAPEAAAAVVSTLELVGGVALVLGVLVRPVAIVAAAELAVAALTAHAGAGFYADEGGWELPGLIALSLIALAVLGAGRLTVVAPFAQRIPRILQ